MSNFRLVEGLFDATFHQAICQYMDEVVPFLSVGLDTELFVRRYRHNDPFFSEIHHQLTDFASATFGLSLKPSYVFLSMYEDGGICPMHIDRPQCFRTIDYLIRQEQADDWPIHIAGIKSDEEVVNLIAAGECHPSPDLAEVRKQTENWETAVLRPNDAVCYSGTHQFHYRSQRLVGTADLAFFHFVPEDFDGPLD